MRPLLLLILFLNGSVAFGQHRTLVLSGKLPADQLHIESYTTFYEAPLGDTLPPAAILTKLFRPFSPSLTKQLQPRNGFGWLQFRIQNTSKEDSLSLWLHVGRHNKIRLSA